MKITTEIEGTGMEVNFDSEKGSVQIYWNGVNEIRCEVSDAVKAIGHVKALAKLGMEDC